LDWARVIAGWDYTFPRCFVKGLRAVAQRLTMGRDMPEPVFRYELEPIRRVSNKIAGRFLASSGRFWGRPTCCGTKRHRS
jgi:hypothetical protein